VNFWDAETRIKVPTIAYMRKSVEVEKTTKKIMVDSEILFRRLLAVSKQRDVNIKSLLQHELAVIPPALFHDDGNIRTFVKSDLAMKLESITDEVLVLPPIEGSSAYIYDGTALLQGLHEAQFRTCVDIAQLILHIIRAC
jgi:hypothetical protein